MTDQDVRDMLAERARAIRPSSDGLRKIEAKLAAAPPRPRRRPAPMLAAAAVTVVALVGVAVFAQEDDDTRVDTGTFTTAPPQDTTDTTPSAPAALPDGVWPFPQDAVDEAVLDDPVETATAYVEARVGLSDRTTVSAYQAGDNSSGEVVFGGDIDTTVFVRRLDGRWHVEGAASELVTLHDADGDGALTAVVESSGWLQSFVTLSSGSSEPLVRAAQYAAGVEITEGLAYDLNTDRAVKAVRFLLTSGEDGTKGLTEVAFRPPFAESAVPGDAVWSEGGLDAVDLVRAYLADRLGEEAGVREPREVRPGFGEVEWDAGLVRVQQLDGYWYVTEAIGDSVQLTSAAFDGRVLRGEVTVADAGVLRISTSDGETQITVDQNGEGTVVPFELASTLTEGPVRVVFQTDFGYVSLAERFVRR